MNYPDLNLRQLRRFLAIIEYGSFSAAARHLHITQQALSTSIAKLEEILGVTLFERRPGGRTAVTLYGNTLVKHARSLLVGEEQAFRELADLRDASGGEVNIGVGEVLAGQMVAEAITRLHRERPDIRIKLLEGYSDKMNGLLLEGDVDLVAGAMRTDATLSNELVHEHLFDMNDIVAARREHPLAGKSNVKLSDLVDYTWLVPRASLTEYQVISETFAAEGLEPPRRLIHSDAVSVGISLLKANDYLIMTSAAFIGSQFGESFAILDIDKPTIRRSAGLTYRRNTPLSPAAKLLLQQIREAANNLIDTMPAHSSAAA